MLSASFPPTTPESAKLGFSSSTKRGCSSCLDSNPPVFPAAMAKGQFHVMPVANSAVWGSSPDLESLPQRGDLCILQGSEWKAPTPQVHVIPMASYAPRFGVPLSRCGGLPQIWGPSLEWGSPTPQLHCTAPCNTRGQLHFKFGTPPSNCGVSPKPAIRSYCSAHSGRLLPHSSTALPRTHPTHAHGCSQQALCFPPSPVLAGHSSNSRIVWEHTRGRYTCMQCPYSTASREEMTLHIEEHRKNAAPAGRMDTDMGMALGRGGGPQTIPLNGIKHEHRLLSAPKGGEWGSQRGWFGGGVNGDQPHRCPPA